jgi:hypothetical protein
MQVKYYDTGLDDLRFLSEVLCINCQLCRKCTDMSNGYYSKEPSFVMANFPIWLEHRISDNKKGLFK